MTLGQLAYFVAVVGTGSFTGAARREHVAQPSLSQQIRALERELGGPLLERLPQGVRLTAAGRALLPKARVAVQAVADGRMLAENALVDGPDALCVAVVGATPPEPVARAIASLRSARPQLTVRLHVHADAARLHQMSSPTRCCWPATSTRCSRSSRQGPASRSSTPPRSPAATACAACRSRTRPRAHGPRSGTGRGRRPRASWSSDSPLRRRRRRAARRR